MSQKYASVHYASYLQLDKVLEAQQLRSESFGEKAHDEMLFIVIHQVYELWFKQIIHELESVVEMFRDEMVDENEISVAVARMDRVIEIQKVMIDQIRILETMTPLDFLDFRNFLFPASGFQSFQFRKVEVMLGLKAEQRITYHNTPYQTFFTEVQRAELEEISAKGTLLGLLENWLERTPFLNFKGFDFLEEYQKAVKKMITLEQEAIVASDYLSEHEKNMRLKMLGDTDTYFLSVLDEQKHQEMVENGSLHLSYKATIAALLINLYRDEPILQMPYRFLAKLIDIDELFTSWRYRHAQMVLRMIGKKVGTGGSSGHEYLHNTAVKHHIFSDLHNISTLLIPRSVLPELPEEVKKGLGFFYTMEHKQGQ
jgi:tryptophan 2,3-dioxygenase